MKKTTKIMIILTIILAIILAVLIWQIKQYFDIKKTLNQLKETAKKYYDNYGKNLSNFWEILKKIWVK